MSNPEESTMRYTRVGDVVTDTLTGESMNVVTMERFKAEKPANLTNQPNPPADLFDTIPDSAIPAMHGIKEPVKPVGPSTVIQELDRDIQDEEAGSSGKLAVSEDEVADLCGCGECFVCMMDELAYEESQNGNCDSDIDDSPDEADFEDDPDDFDLGGEA